MGQLKSYFTVRGGGNVYLPTLGKNPGVFDTLMVSVSYVVENASIMFLFVREGSYQTFLIFNEMYLLNIEQFSIMFRKTKTKPIRLLSHSQTIVKPKPQPKPIESNWTPTCVITLNTQLKTLSIAFLNYLRFCNSKVHNFFTVIIV